MARALDPRRIAALEERWGKIIAAREGKGGGQGDLSRYRMDPVGFARDVLRDSPWARQVEMAESVRDCPQTAVRGANSVGKDHEAAALMLWWVYTRPGALVIVTGPTQRQVDEIVFGRELKRLWGRSGLPGELLAHALRLPAPENDALDDGDIAYGILGFVSTDQAKLTGHHAPNVMCVITEAQGVKDVTFEAMFNNATGPDDRFLVVGNPLEPAGRFFRCFRAKSGWNPIKMPAREHPNVVEGRTVIPGGPSRESLERARREEGEDSRFWRVFVEAEFPDSATDSLVTRAWIETAFARFDAGQTESSTGTEPVVGLDVAREGGDLCAAAPVTGRVARAVVAWGPSAENPTFDTVRRAEQVMVQYGGRPDPGVAKMQAPELDFGHPVARGVFVVDVALMGGGVVDRLRERGWTVADWNGQRGARDADEPERWENMRGWAYWTLREAFQQSSIVLARDELLAEDLLATRYEAGTRDRTKIIRKPEIKSTLGRSPDRADALMMAWHYANAGGGAGAADASTPAG